MRIADRLRSIFSRQTRPPDTEVDTAAHAEVEVVEEVAKKIVQDSRRHRLGIEDQGDQASDSAADE